MDDGLRARLTAVGSVIGVPVTVVDDVEWSLDDRGLRVGLGWYRERGHGDSEAVALALLQLWQAVQGTREPRDRARRKRTLAETLPHAEPLLEAVLRLQLAQELLIAFPGFRPALVMAVRRSQPVHLAELPRHLQWVALLFQHGMGEGGSIPGAGDTRAGDTSAGNTGAGDPDVDDAVAREWSALGGPTVSPGSPAGFDPVRRVLAPGDGASALRRYERALALLLPPYERLLESDLAERGLATRGSGPAGDEESVDAGAVPAGDGTSADERAEADAHANTDTNSSEGALGENEVEEPEETEGARAGDGRETPEGADLFAAERAAFVDAILPTPMPAEGSQLQSMIETLLESLEGSSDRIGPADLAFGPATGGPGGSTPSSRYLERVEELAPAIERMRELWARVIAEQIAPRRVPGRHAQPEGDSLVDEALAGAVIEAVSGIARPGAYRQREVRRRRARRAGSTDYVLLIDRSASMTGAAARVTADAVLIMLEALAGAERDARHAEALAGIPIDLDIRTSLIVYDSEARVVKPLSGGLDDEVRRAVDAATRTSGGATNDGAALLEAARQLRILRREPGGPEGAGVGGVERRRIVIVLSDGGTNDAAASDRAVALLRRAGVAVHGIGIGSEEIVRRYAPTSSKIEDPRDIPEALHRLIEDELP